MSKFFNYNAKVNRVIDGDTIDATLDLGFNVKLDLKIRMAGINTPELKSKDPEEKAKAQEARAFLKEKIEGKDIVLDSKGLDKYGRWIGVIRLGTENINDTMVKKNLAVKYME